MNKSERPHGRLAGAGTTFSPAGRTVAVKMEFLVALDGEYEIVHTERTSYFEHPDSSPATAANAYFRARQELESRPASRLLRAAHGSKLYTAFATSTEVLL